MAGISAKAFNYNLYGNPMNINVNEIFLNASQALTDSSESARIKMYQELKYFYENDVEMIVTYLTNLLKEKGLYSEKTLNKLIIRHRDNIQKVLKKVTAGIYENTPVRVIMDVDFDLSDYLSTIGYNLKVKDIFKKSKYYGLSEMFVYWDGEKVRLEILTPDRYIVETTDNDYLKKEKIYIQKSRNINGKFELICDVWTNETYSILLGDGTLEKRPVGEQELDVQPNIYRKIPVIALRFSEGDSYFPEPNWDLFHTQIALDIKRTNNFYTEMFQTFGIYVATNLNMKAGETLSPNQILKAEGVKSDDVAPSLQFISPDIDFAQLNNNIDFEVLDMLRSQGINTASASIDQKTQSGTAKTIDELELMEERENVKENLYSFEIELLNLIRIVHNANSLTKIPDGDFEVVYSEEKSIESIDDKVKRREMESKYGIKTPIDFIMEDFECSEEEANKIYEDNKAKEIPTEENNSDSNTEENPDTNTNQ